MYGNISNQRTSDNTLKVIVFLSVCIIYAFSNIRELSVAIQFIFVGITVVNIIFYKKMRLTIHFIWMLLFIIWALFISLLSEYNTVSIIEVVNLTLKLLFYTSLIMFINNEARFNFVLKTLVISGLILVIRVIALTPFNDWGTDRLGSALDLNPNTLGLSLSFAAIVSVYLGTKLKNKNYFIVTILFAIIGLLTGSKKALIAIFGGIFLLLYLRTTNKIKKFFILMLIFLGVCLIYMIMMNVPFLYEVIGSRVEEAMFFSDTAEIDKSTLHRSMMIQEAWNVFKENPITGIGLENFRMYSSFSTYSHNNYMEILVSTGILGFIIYYSLPVLILLYAIYRKNNTDYSLIITILTIILILDIANVSYRQLITQVMIALCVSRVLMLKTNK